MGGMRSKNPLYITWKDMNYRCYRPHHKDFRNYGGRGITVHPDWQWPHGLFNFADYVFNVLGPRPMGRSLDRIDNNKGYEPGNIRWSTYQEQVNNARSNRYAKLIRKRQEAAAERERVANLQRMEGQ